MRASTRPRPCLGHPPRAVSPGSCYAHVSRETATVPADCSPDVAASGPTPLRPARGNRLRAGAVHPIGPPRTGACPVILFSI
eukprot:1176710-Prorocentrum_minimum.AAC.9